MKITHDWRIQPVDWQLWIDKGLAVDGIGGVTLNYQFTQSDLQEEALLLKGKSPEEPAGRSTSPQGEISRRTGADPE